MNDSTLDGFFQHSLIKGDNFSHSAASNNQFSIRLLSPLPPQSPLISTYFFKEGIHNLFWWSGCGGGEDGRGNILSTKTLSGALPIYVLHTYKDTCLLDLTYTHTHTITYAYPNIRAELAEENLCCLHKENCFLIILFHHFLDKLF